MTERQRTATSDEPQKVVNPYIGLRPYQETERSLFFGRDKDRKIFVDMVLANRLTLLFAASGIGKSSLLQAAVLPQLKDSTKENLDAVYCNNWAGEPMRSLRDATLKALADRGRIDPNSLPSELKQASLARFFEFLTHFVRHPLVIILDQFEEFFHYHRATADFTSYRNQLVELITDRSLPISLVISMREDFALTLNAFKPEIPTVLFNNFYRLEKLPRSEAEVAIVQPAAHRGYNYEPELLQTLLVDLAAREQSAGTPVAETALFIEPPYLQIICSQLFELDRDDPEKKLRLSTYAEHGRARGLLSSYIGRVTFELTYPERKLASKCFSHLITRRGTKVAHTASSLARELREEPVAVAAILKKLEQARLLRSQSQDLRTWYELYHDLFSDSVEEWNERFKARERLRRTVLGIAAFVLAGMALFAAYNAGINATSHHLRLSIKAGPKGQVELYRGQADTMDLFGLQRYVAETGILRQEIEPDQLFAQRRIFDRRQLDTEWADHLSAEDRLHFYRGRGEFPLAFKIAHDRLNSGDEERARAAINLLTSLKSKRSYDEISQGIKLSQNHAIGNAFFRVFQCREEHHIISDNGSIIITNRTSSRVTQNQSPALISFLYEIIKDPKISSLDEAIKCLILLEKNRALPAIVKSILAASVELQNSIVSALRDLDHSELAKHFTAQYPSSNDTQQGRILEILAKFKSPETRIALIDLLKKASPGARIAGLNALRGQWQNASLVEPYLFDTDTDVAQAAAKALNYPGSAAALRQIRSLKSRGKDAQQISSLDSALSRLDPKSADAERQFAKILRGRFTVLSKSECSTSQGSFLDLELGANLLELTLTISDARTQKFIINCAPADILLSKIPIIENLALHADPTISGSIIQRLLKLDPKEAFFTLQIMIDSDSYDRQQAAIQIVRDMRQEKGYALLSGLVNRHSASSDIRLKALAAMDTGSNFGIAEGPFRATIAAQLRLAAREKENSEFRAQAATALATWLGEAAIPDLRQLFSDGERTVRKAAAEGLLAIGRPSATANLRAVLSERKAKSRTAKRT